MNLSRLALAALLALAPAAAMAQPSDDAERVAFRIRFGPDAASEVVWDGSVTVDSGELLSLRDWHPRPENEVGSSDWKLSNRKGATFNWRPWEHPPNAGFEPYYWTPGVILDVLANPGTRVNVDTKQGRFSFNPRGVRAGDPQPFLEGRVMVDRVVAPEKLSDDQRQDDFADLAAGPQGDLWAAWVAFRDSGNEVLARRFDGSTWGPAQTVTEQAGDVFLVQLGQGGGRMWAVWSNQVDGNFDLYARPFEGSSWGRVERLTEHSSPDVFHRVTTDSEGSLWVVWQGFRDGQADIFARRHDGKSWGEPSRVSTSSANDWDPTVAAGPDGAVTVAWDTYDKGDYDVMMRTFAGGEWRDAAPVADTRLYEAHADLVYDDHGRLWAAWNESGMNWGKDTGFILNTEGTRLYEYRTLKVAVWDGKSWSVPATDVNEALSEGRQQYDDFPRLARDGEGRVWLFARRRTLRQRDLQSEAPAHRAAWEIWASTLDGARWTEPLHFPLSYGRQDMRWGLARDSRGGLWAAWPTDHRDFEAFLFQQADVYAGKLPNLTRPTAAPRLVERPTPELFFHDMAPTEQEDLARLRAYEIRSGDVTYKIYRGDTHRHTEFSMDGNNDGSLWQVYRYAIDAADLDYLLVSDHNGAGGPDVPYVNWLLQQAVDVMSVADEFQPFYGYERSITYPDGHRNVLLTRRGVPTLPISEAERTHEAGAERLYAYLKKNGGIAISHTSATNMGTDWRDNDPAVEPLVEIYQGDRVSAEYEGAPRAAWSENPASAPGGFRPLGYVWNAWAKGYKLGVQAASDHLSTHISYACTIAEDFSRQGLIDAMKKRHSYGATDNIVLDYRLRADSEEESLQGDIVEVDGGFRLWVKVLGTSPIRQIDVIRNQEFLHTRHRLPQQTSFEFVDNAPLDGENFYYVRVQQENGEIAWSSPIWVTRR